MSRNYSPYVARRISPVLLLVLPLLALSGCSPEVKFRFNAVYALKQTKESDTEFNSERQVEIGNILTAMFGTPDAPHVPPLAGVDMQRLLDERKLEFAAGPVASDELGRGHGLYREHCGHCHGITGDGAGPTAGFLNPYPRDYRMGVFKFKSTPRGFKPTHEDLKRILLQGIPGTAMPTFLVLPENEIEALIHYVRYLSIRGEFERVLLNYVATEIESDARIIGEGSEQAEQTEIVRSLALEVVEKWIAAESMATAVPAPDPDREVAASILHGREVFYGQISNCAKCHGESQLGDGQTDDFNDWAKELEPKSESLAEYLQAGAFPPRNAQPRNLRLGVYRGGRRPVDLYWRIRNGIDGTPMPGSKTEILSDEDVWSLVEYVRSLPYESISQPRLPASFQRERPQ